MPGGGEGEAVRVGLLTLTLVLPPLLLVLMLVMDRVERPLRELQVDAYLDALEGADPEEVEAFVRDGLAPALDRYWRRRRLARLLPGLPR